MELNKIADLFAAVEGILKKIKNGSDNEEKKKLGWKVLSHLTQVYGIVNSANVRAPGQRLIAKLVIDESNRMIDETVNSIEDIPGEFNLMLESIKITGHDNDIEKTG